MKFHQAVNFVHACMVVALCTLTAQMMEGWDETFACLLFGKSSHCPHAACVPCGCRDEEVEPRPGVLRLMDEVC